MWERLNARLVEALLGVAALLAFVLGFLVVADVVGRGFFNRPVKGTPEMVSMSIVIICFLLAPYAVRSGGMIRTGVLVDTLPPRGRRLSSLLTGILGAAFFGLIVWGSVEPALYAWSSGEFEGEGALRVPVWPARLVVLVGALLVALIYLSQAAHDLLTLLRGETQAPP